MKKLFISCFLSFFGAAAWADCGVDNAKITFVYQYYDGSIFVNFNKDTSCNCPIPSRMAFNTADPGYDYIKAMVLLAYASGKSITANSNIAGCPIHGNTAKMNYFGVFPN
ncbi:MAG: hypothetical protein RL497_1173 [Pseudomonadota bacterium]|jgi:hypothetical protein